MYCDELKEFVARCEKTPAVVVGMCGHGLAIARALQSSGIPVIGLSSDLNEPGAKTNTAMVCRVDRLDVEGIIELLFYLRRTLGQETLPPVFLANDRMVACVGRQWSQLENLCRVSWSNSRQDVLSLLNKDGIEARCRDVGLNYPESFIIQSAEDVERIRCCANYPLIVKPIKPLSAFKIKMLKKVDEILDIVNEYGKDLPFLVQRWIPGTDKDIFFGALYLDKGEIIARFEGHKLYSRPMGHTCLAEPYFSNEIHEMTSRFFGGLNMSGPVSLEVKRDQEGCYWVIEPTVGRTDYWVGLTISNGVNIPLIEYCSVQSLNIPKGMQCEKSVWVNGERDTLGLLRLLLLKPAVFLKFKPVFLYFSLRDPRPYLQSLVVYIVLLLHRIGNRLKKIGRLQN